MPEPPVPEPLNESDCSLHQTLAGTGGASGAHRFIVAFRKTLAVWQVSDAAVGEFDDDGPLERRPLLDGQAEFGEDFAGQGDQDGVAAQPDGLDLGPERLFGPRLDVEDAKGLHQIKKWRRLGLAVSGRDLPGPRDLARIVACQWQVDDRRLDGQAGLDGLQQIGRAHV